MDSGDTGIVWPERRISRSQSRFSVSGARSPRAGQIFRSHRLRRPWLGNAAFEKLMGWVPSTSILGTKILDDRLGVGLINRRAHDVDHFLYLSLPLCRTKERGIHLDIVKAVTSRTIGFDFLHAWAR